jgi:hypothetical protein
MLVDPVAVYGHVMNRAVFRIEALVAHAKLAALDPHHLARDADPLIIAVPAKAAYYDPESDRTESFCECLSGRLTLRSRKESA